MRYHFKVHKEGKGYWAECIELDGCVTQGETKAELRKNMQDALNLFLGEPPNSNAVFPPPDKAIRKKGVEAVQVDPKVAFALMLRMERLIRGLSQGAFAELLGLGGLYSYQKLESAKTANPRWDTIVKIKKVVKNLDLDDLLD
jgi:antitoxin HicB